jgi:hypothetical protein
MIHSIWFSLALLFLLLFIGVQYLDPIKKESMRTLYTPTVHPIVQYITPNYYGASYSTEDMNQWVDFYIARYFDDQNVPYLDTIDLYRKYIVNKGVLKQEYKNKLRDMCHYIIDIVIPNLPTIEKPDPQIIWPKIEWLSDDWKSYNYSFNLDAMANLFGGSMNYNRTASSGSESKGDDSEGSASPGSASPGSLSPGSDLSGSSSSTSSPPQNKVCDSCPSDCFGQFLTELSQKQGSNSPGTSSSPGSSSPGSDPGEDSTGKYKSSTGKEHDENSGQGPSGILMVDQVLVTNEPVKNPSSQELNEWVLKKMKYYVDIDIDLSITKQAELDFKNFIKMYGPIDRAHKNKLRDLVYYFMENIIPGLPTQSKPVCYVEWRPIRWLANSNL